MTNLPHHVVHRGHNRKQIFFDDYEYRYYLASVADFKRRLSIKVYAYCLMPNHIHLILNPTKRASDLSNFMKYIAARQTRLINKKYQRSGTLWESRFKSSVIDSEQYLLECCRYIELNPVRAKMVKKPSMYPWSSFAAKVGEQICSWIDSDFFPLRFSDDIKEDQRAYKRFVEGGTDHSEVSKLIATAVHRNQLTGDKDFVRKIAIESGRWVPARSRGRPPKSLK